MSVSAQSINPANEAAPMAAAPVEAANNAPDGGASPMAAYSLPASDKTSSPFRWWIIALVILAAPIGLPILLALLSVPFSIIMALASIVFSLAMAGVAFIAAGAISVFSVPFIIFTEPGSAVFIGGIGLVGIGLGIIILIANIKLAKMLFGGLKFVGGKIFKKKELE